MIDRLLVLGNHPRRLNNRNERVTFLSTDCIQDVFRSIELGNQLFDLSQLGYKSILCETRVGGFPRGLVLYEANSWHSLSI